MPKKRSDSEKAPDFVKWFPDLNKDSVSVAGGKGANLAEIYNMGVNVPPGFVVTAQAYAYFIEKAGIRRKIDDILKKIDFSNTDDLDKATKQIRKLIIDGQFPEEMETEILESYEDLSASDTGFSKTSAHEMLKRTSDEIFVACRSSATTEDLASASFAGQQDSFINVKGKEDVLHSIKKVFASLFTSRATYYRQKRGFGQNAEIAVVVQKMIDADKAGVIFSKDPARKDNHIILEAVFGLGEGIVSGTITPDTYIISEDLKILKKDIRSKKIAITRNSAGTQSIIKLKPEKSKQEVLSDREIKDLSRTALKLEAHYDKPQDIEFAIESGEIYIVQTRPITTMGDRFSEVKRIKGDPILKGLAASPGIASGKIRVVKNLKDLDKIKQGDILVTIMTNPDMVVTMQKCAAIVTDEGGLTAHAAIVSREMGIPAVVGTQTATTKLKEGEMITVNGFTGEIYKGKAASTSLKEVDKVTVKTKTEIKVIVDLPDFAERAAKTGLKKVGLARIEGTIASSKKHPDYYLKHNKVDEYEEVVFKGIRKIAAPFEEVWVRTSDIRSDEFHDLEGAPPKEENPMLGMHGIRYGLKHPKILMAELKAMKRVAHGGKKIGILMPQVITVDEVRRTKEMVKKLDFKDAKFGVMIETPAAVQMIKDICKVGIDFISFGTNDLTQYILAVDRGNDLVQDLYNEMDPAVLYQLEYVIRVCKREKVETSICGQAGSKKQMVKFLLERGIDSISVNADVAAVIASYVHELETKGHIHEEEISKVGTEVGSGGLNLEQERNPKSEEPKIPGAALLEPLNEDETLNIF